MAHRVGIDLGTTNSAIAITELGRQRCVKVDQNEYSAAVFPSCIAVGKNGQPIYGGQARRAGGVREFKRAMGTSQKFRIGDQEFSATQLSALLLARIKEQFETQHGDIEGAVITVPANYGDQKRAEVKEAGRLAGLRVLRVINEPSAAAIAYSLSDRPPGENSLVIDWGGGTLDVSLVDCIDDVLDVKANDGDELCGGKDIDAAVLDLLIGKARAQFGNQVNDPVVRNELLLKCEEIKIWLSTNDIWDEPIDIRSLKGFVEVEILRNQLELVVSPLVSRVMAAVNRTLEKNPEGKLQPKDISDIILVGGSCLLPMFQQEVQRMFGRPGRIDLNPMEVVALGAAYQAEHADQTGKLVTIHSLTHSLGVGCLGQDRLGVLRPDHYAEILPAGSKLPSKKTHVFRTVQDFQESIEVEVFENPDGRMTVKGLTPWSSRSLDNLPRLRAGSFPVEVTFDYSVDQTLTVNVRVPGHAVNETWKADHQVRIEVEHAEAKTGVDDFRDRSLKKLSEFLAKVRATVKDGTPDVVRVQLQALEDAIQRGSIDDARKAKSQLGAALFDAGIQLS
ncbi:MAG: Hsp70 family protein [Planctomycetota bacterium]